MPLKFIIKIIIVSLFIISCENQESSIAPLFLNNLRTSVVTLKPINNFELPQKDILFLGEKIVSNEICYHTVSSYSSKLIIEKKSTIGNEAQYLLLGHLKRVYPPYLVSELSNDDKFLVKNWIDNYYKKIKKE